MPISYSKLIMLVWKTPAEFSCSGESMSLYNIPCKALFRIKLVGSFEYNSNISTTFLCQPTFVKYLETVLSRTSYILDRLIWWSFVLSSLFTSHYSLVLMTSWKNDPSKNWKLNVFLRLYLPIATESTMRQSYYRCNSISMSLQQTRGSLDYFLKAFKASSCRKLTMRCR